MSITKDFERRIDLMIPDGYNIVDVDNLLVYTRALEAMLQKIQSRTTAESADPDDPFSLIFVARFDMSLVEQMAKLLEGTNQ